MEKKKVILLGVCAMAIFLMACGNKNPGVEPAPTEAVEATVTPTKEPSATAIPTTEPTATKAPKPTTTPTPTVKDTYQPGTVNEKSFSSEWMDLRFTRQEDLLLGTAEGIEMYAQCADGARVEVYTEPVPEEYLDMTELDYLTVMMDNLLDADYKILDQSKDVGGNIGTEYYAGINLKVSDAAGKISYRYYVIRKKEAKMIIISMTCPNSDESLNSMFNLLKCFSGYHSEPVILPEGSFGRNIFRAGVFTENGYENEWLNMRITLPEEATLEKREPVSDDSVGFDVYLNDMESVVQCTIGYFGGMNITTDEYLLQTLDGLKAYAQFDVMETQGYTIFYDDAAKPSELGGQEYSKISLEVMTPEGFTACSDLYGRIQDNYMVFIMVMYEKGSEDRDKLLGSFGTY